MADLPQLVAAAAHVAFHGVPGSALPLLDEAAELAAAGDRDTETAVLGWLRGVVLGATGRWGESLAAVDAVLREPPSGARGRRVEALAAAVAGSVHRQLGLHAEARELDERGRAAAEPLGLPASDALLDCLVGLAADAVGLEDVRAARAGVARAAQVLGERAAVGWRPRCRLAWVRAEVALLAGEPVLARTAAAEALALAEQASARRHVAKSLLFLGVAHATVGGEAAEAQAVRLLRRAAVDAETLGVTPLVWPARAVLAALLGADGRQEESQACRTAARQAVLVLAAGLPPRLRDPWLTRPELRALAA